MRLAETGVVCLGLSGDGRLLALAKRNQEIVVLDEAGTPVRRWRAEGREVTALALGPDGTALATADGWGRVRLWDAGAGRPLCAWEAHGGRVEGLAFCPDGRLLTTAGGDGRVSVWATGPDGPKLVHGARHHRGPALAVAVARGGAVIASGGADCRVRLAHAGGEPVTCHGHTGSVAAVVVDPEGKYVISAGRDGSARLFDAAAGRCLAALFFEHALLAAGLYRRGAHTWLALVDCVGRRFEYEVSRLV